MMTERLCIDPGTVGGYIRIPSSKSLCHRAIICAALAEGTSVIRNVTVSKDIEATLNAMELLGAQAHWNEDTLMITGNGGVSRKEGQTEIFCNESGSTLRFLVPIAAALGVEARFTGAGRLPERPLTSYYEIMEERDFAYHREGERHLPLVIEDPWRSGVFRVAGNISSQFITGLLLALPLLQGESVIELTTELESKPYVDLTLDMMERFGVTVRNEQYHRFVIEGSQTYQAQEYTAEGDYSQAAFLLAAASVAGDEQGLYLTGLNSRSRQGDQVIMDLLSRMGAAMEWTTDGALHVKRAPLLTNVEMDASQCPDLVPIAAVLGALGRGTMRIVHAERLRLKESDRLKAVAAELAKSGVSIEETEDGLCIEGLLEGHVYPGGEADSWNDHRIAMSAAVLALCTEKGIRLSGAGTVEKSWPTFWSDLEHIGGRIHEW